MWHKSLGALIVIMASGKSFGLDLRSAVKIGFENSPQVAIARSASEESRWRKVEAFSTYLPSLTAGATYLSDYRYAYTDIAFGGQAVSIPNIIPTTTYTLSAQYTLFEGFGGTNRFRAARSLEKSANEALTWAEFELENHISQQFYRAIAAKSLQDVAEQNVKTLEDHLREANLLKKAGAATNYDVLRVEVQVSQAHSDLLNAQDNTQIELGRLFELLGKEEVEAIEGHLPELDPEMVSNASVSSIQDRADLTSGNDRAEGLRLQELASKAHWLPRISAFWNYQSYNNRNDHYDDWSNFRDAYTLGLNLTWNLFDGFYSTSRSRQAVEQRYQADKSNEMKRLKARQDFDVWKRKFIYYCAVVKARRDEIAKAQESVRLAKEGRRVGARTNTDLLDAETDLNRSQAGYVSAQLGATEALLNLEMATGRRYH